MEKPIVFKNERGKQLIGILHLPEGKRNFPLVIICHRFGDDKTQRRFVRLARVLEKNRIASFRFDFEGCGDPEGDFLEATVEKEIKDLDSVVRYLQKIKNITIKKLLLLDIV